MSERLPTMWFIGQGRWCRLLARAVDEHGSGRFQGRAIELDHASRAVFRVLALRHVRPGDAVIRVGFRPAARTWRGWAFDRVWTAFRWANPRARIVVYWIGSDVLKAMRERHGEREGRIIRRVAGKDAMHIAGAPWLVSELATLGIEGRFVPIPWLYAPVPVTAPPFPETFTVVSYIPDSKRVFYGWRSVEAAARALPDVAFHVVAGTGAGLDDPPANVRFLGWVDGMDGVYRAATVVVRMPEHDAIGGTVLEGLAYGKPVIYSYELDHCEHVPFDDAEGLIAVLRRLRDEWVRGELRLNESGREFVIRKFQPDLAVARLEKLVSGIGGGS